jgi:hypothetical protein
MPYYVSSLLPTAVEAPPAAVCARQRWREGEKAREVRLGARILASVFVLLSQ